MSNKKPNIASQVRTLVEKPITELGYTLWDVSFYKEGAEMILEIAVDKKGGMSLDDCSLLTNLVEPLIDALDPIEGAYCLMVASAGCDRELQSELQIEAAMSKNSLVSFKLFSVFEGKKEYRGHIKQFDNDIITIADADTEIALPRKLISKMKASFEESIIVTEE